MLCWCPYVTHTTGGRSVVSTPHLVNERSGAEEHGPHWRAQPLGEAHRQAVHALHLPTRVPHGHASTQECAGST